MKQDNSQLVSIKGKIYAITEAYSMQPITYYVGQRFGYPNSDTVSEIKLEFQAEWPNGMQRGEYLYFVYGSNGNVLVECLANAVNVQYQVEQD